LPRIVVDRIMIEQVLLNLVKNGIEAMGDIPFDRRHLTIQARVLDERMAGSRRRRSGAWSAGRGCRADFCTFLHHQAGRHGHRAGYLPLDYRVSPG
jgi:signal transduction histidine kinase